MSNSDTCFLVAEFKSEIAEERRRMNNLKGACIAIAAHIILFVTSMCVIGAVADASNYVSDMRIVVDALVSHDLDAIGNVSEHLSSEVYARVLEKEQWYVPEQVQRVMESGDVWFVQTKEVEYDTYYMYKIHLSESETGNIIIDIYERYELIN